MSQSRILIAAYNNGFGRALASMLGPQAHEPTFVMTGSDALEHLQGGGADLCFMQDRLADLSGLDVCEQFCKEPSPHKTPIVVFSHRAEVESLAREKGASAFLGLPCQPQQLGVLVRQLRREKVVLLVDDSRVIHTIVEEVLKGAGFEVLHAFDAEEGLQKVLESMPDLIISDIEMPGMDGFEFCQRVKEGESTEHIPVILHSTRGSGLDIDKGFDAGANDYLTKPIDPDEFLSRVQQVIGGDEDQARERILVVDDSKTIRNFMSQGLSQQGFEVTTAANGREGLAAAIQKRPDLVVTDLEMPVMTGRELTRELRKHELLKDTPVIMLTASGAARDRIKGKHAGVDAYLAKPFPPDKLVVLVEKLVAERKLLAERGDLQNRNQFIREVFGRYMTEDVVKTLLESSGGLQLGGERRKVTILMSDLRGFSSISERMAPEEVVSMLNIYLEAMTNAIVKRGGTIDEFIGDAILTIFGAPIAKEDDAMRAVACALEMQLAMDRVNEHNRKSGFPELEMGIGISTGEVVVGNIGSKKRAKYGIVGSHVNMTARIESYTVGGQILISEATLEETSEIVKSGRQRQIEPKGAKKPLTIYEVTGMGEPYNIFLPGDSEELTRLATKIPLEFTVLEEKFAGRTRFEGTIEELSVKNATISTAELPAVLSNLKMEVGGGGNGDAYKDVYGKVMETLPDGTRFQLRFTSVPKEAAAFLESVLAESRKA